MLLVKKMGRLDDDLPTGRVPFKDDRLGRLHDVDVGLTVEPVKDVAGVGDLAERNFG
jgi:hypothetical protein